MAKEICISSTPHETRLAILEDDQLAEIYYERENEYTLAGSIYNGRVTRVLPGMQSAFVDVGLERDAFLYVTDFLELEDAEETDELEKAAVSGGSQPPREVRRGGKEPAQERPGPARQEDRGSRSPQKSEPRQESKQENQTRDRRLTVEAVPEAESAALPSSGTLSFTEPTEAGEEESSEAGSKRWRGRRRRRSSRGSANSSESLPASSETPSPYIEEISEPEIAPQIHAAGASTERSYSPGSSPEPAHLFDHAPAAAPVPFVLPGESLSKYGGAPAEGAAAESASRAAAPPVRPSSSFKPATLIESPIQWDGSGLLPGESLARRSSRADEAAQPDLQEETKHAVKAFVEPVSHSSDEPETSGSAPDAVEEQEFFEEVSEPPTGSATRPEIASAMERIAPAATEDYLFEEEEELVGEDEFEESVESSFAADDAEPEPDRSASHNVDPLPPAEFRFFGLGKKKVEDAPKPAAKPALASSYAPGSGLIEEETIEEEEYEAPALRIATQRLKNMIWRTLKRRRCPRICVPATWVKCSRKRTSTTAFN
jgi:ribonuclease G